MNRFAITKITVLLLAAALAATAGAAEKPKDFAFGIPLTVDADSAFYRAMLPASFYTGSARADQGDLRVFNGDGAAVPYARLEPPAASREKKPTTALTFFPLRIDEQGGDLSGMSLTISRNVGNTTVNLTTRDGQPVAAQRLAGYLIDASEIREPISAITLSWARKPGGMNARVRVEASDDLNGWRTVVGDAPLLDLEYDGRHLVRDRIEFRQSPGKFLRLSWQASQQPLQLDAVRAEFGERVLETPRQWVEATGAPVPEKENEFQFDLGGALPADRIEIELPEINSVVPAQLAARASKEDPWHEITSMVSYRLRQDTGEVSAPAVAVAPATFRYWLLRVDSRSGGLGRGEPRMRAGWIPQEIVFAARGTGPFLIAYGNTVAAPSALPVVTLVPGYSSAPEILATMAVARAGSAVPLGSLDQVRAPREYRRAALWAILILGVGVLGWMAWQLSRQLNAPPTVPERALEPQADVSTLPP